MYVVPAGAPQIPGYPAMPGSSDVMLRYVLYRCEQTIWNQFPARSVVRYGLICIIFGVFSFTDFVSWFLISKKLKRSDWISNSRASNFRIGFPS